jgi:eukaryotic-like serine/threonine-protein kinase
MSFSFLTGVAVLRTGDVIDRRFRIAGLSGEGQSAEIYRAQDLECARDVAIKLQRPRTFESTATFKWAGAMLTDEADLGERLEGIPGVPAHVRRGCHGDREYLAIDYIDGILLRELINRSRPLYREAAVSVIAQLSEILVEVHGRDTVHQDLKPDNVIVDYSGRVWLFDFGISSTGDADSTADADVYTGCGTPGYAAPEQYRKRHHRPQVDIYSLGAMLFEMLAMRLPYRDHPRPEKETTQFPAGVLAGLPVPDELKALGLAMVAFDPQDRPASVADVRASLQPMLPPAGSPVHPKAPRPDPAAFYRLPPPPR